MRNFSSEWEGGTLPAYPRAKLAMAMTVSLTEDSSPRGLLAGGPLVLCAASAADLMKDTASAAFRFRPVSRLRRACKVRGTHYCHLRRRRRRVMSVC